ncbi:tumor necrosis factor receptor superfamily member 5 isoform X1 [Etheostoma cragini]|uniref:tumor necrosis factor receptor superfamily member 5 isoform X1 n=1 Tax=Etheostoma cragini TaxID=417921 RepID=UPI00155E4267|nr:tumor necrosis factor receptor superfamily member 5 isoform X1 [Etheostoma cragini]
MTCTKSTKDGTCCDRCAAGEYMKAECDRTKRTECAKCDCGFYTATKNNLLNCLPCMECISQKHQRKVKDCTTQENTVCECVAGYYCHDDQCDYCRQVSHCPPGEGVKVPATRMNDTICHPCGDKTYSNVTDFFSPCQTHTRCEDLGRLLKTPGTRTTDAICGNFKSLDFPWMLPAGLWSGLVLTALVLFGLVCWRAKRKSNKAASSNVPVTLVEMLPATPITSLDLPLPFTELNGHCQENCIVECYKLPLFNKDDNVVSGVTQDSMDSFLPKTPLKPSVSFAESSHTNGSAGYCTSNFLRSHSEPQEDEWCGT